MSCQLFLWCGGFCVRSCLRTEIFKEISAEIILPLKKRRGTKVDTKSPGRQDFCPKISDNSLEGCLDNALKSALERRLFQPNMVLDTRITPESCPLAGKVVGSPSERRVRATIRRYLDEAN